MITENQVREVAQKYFEDRPLVVSRANGSWPMPCGWQVCVEIGEDYHASFFHEGNDYRSLVSKMIVFSENALTE